MAIANFFFASSTPISSVNQVVSDKSSVNSSSSSRVDSLLPPIPSTDLSLLTPATSADIGTFSSPSKEKAELTVVRRPERRTAILPIVFGSTCRQAAV